MDDLVSIITPSYNTAEYIIETIKSVQLQTYHNWEMIIVDDSSTDDIDDKIIPYLSDDRIKYFKNSVNCGAAFSRNRALREAKGKWIAFLDSDDLWAPDKLKKQIDFMETNGYHFSYTLYSEIDDKGNPLGVYWTGPKKIGRFCMFLFNYMGCLTVMYDSEYIGLVQIADIKKRNDYAIWIKVVKKAPAFLLNENLAQYRVRTNGSITNREKTPLLRLKYNYELWHCCEKKGVIHSLFLTAINAVFGTIKKVIYKHNSN